MFIIFHHYLDPSLGHFFTFLNFKLGRSRYFKIFSVDLEVSPYKLPIFVILKINYGPEPYATLFAQEPPQVL